MEEEYNYFKPEPWPEPCPEPTRYYSPISVCKCLIDADSSEQVLISARKEFILSTVTRTETYLRERRIPELIQFLLTKVIAEESSKPIIYLESLLDNCMLFRACHGLAPVLYEDRHLEAIVKSFDPGQRGWLSIGQVRRLSTTLGLTLQKSLDERISTEVVLTNLRKTQEKELYDLLWAGIAKNNDEENNGISKTSSAT